MDKKILYDNFMNLNYNRITNKQKYKAKNYIITSLNNTYNFKIRNEKIYKFKFIPFRCQNIESYSPNYQILLIAHYDTHWLRQDYVSAYITRRLQQLSKFKSLIYSMLFIIVFTYLLIIFRNHFNIFHFFLIISIFLVLLYLLGFPLFLSVNSRRLSPSPIHDDNNSGVITLIHVAKILYEGGYGDKIKLLFTDCEEKGLLGSKMFIKNNLDNLEDKIIINFDCVGRGSNLFITSKNNSELAKELQSFLSSRDMKSTLYAKSYSDDKSFQKYNLNSIGLIRGDIAPNGIKLLHWTHTSHDTLDNINLEYVTEIIQVITEFIESKI